MKFRIAATFNAARARLVAPEQKAAKTAAFDSRMDPAEAACATLYRDTSRTFLRPENRRTAVKEIDRFGCEVMKVFSV